MTSRLSLLIAAHNAALAAYDASNDEDFRDRDDLTGNAVDAIRDEILNHRPTLDEVAIKAVFMAGSRTFTEWDNFDPVMLIKALTPIRASQTATGICRVSDEADITIANVVALLNTIVSGLLDADRESIDKAVADIDRMTALAIIARDALQRTSDDLLKAGGAS